MRGQLSAEMLMLLLLVLGMAVLAFSYMNGMVKNVGESLNAGTSAAMVENNPYYCTTDSDCEKFQKVKRCVDNICRQ